jgi:hypothetical protein
MTIKDAHIYLTLAVKKPDFEKIDHCFTKAYLLSVTETALKNTHLVENLPMIIPGQFGINYPSGFRDEAF